MISHLRRRLGVMQALLERWPNPIEAMATWGPVNAKVRFPFQLRNSLVRLKQLTGQVLSEAGLHR